LPNNDTLDRANKTNAFRNILRIISSLNKSHCSIFPQGC